MAVSKRVRYEVLRRDDYTCRYCGDKAPDVVITIDHVVPTVLGGSDEPDNLVAACKDCNSGKTSSSPDAPLVANVAADALRWSQAMQAAAGAMLRDRKAREAEHEQFRAWWTTWGYGDGNQRRTVPMDGAWWVTVDQLRAAGLPLAALKDCIDLAMSRRKIRDEDKFRYMCGAAWKMIGKLREAASKIAVGPPGSAAAPSASEDDEDLAALAVDGYSLHLLDLFSESERDEALCWARDVRGEEPEDSIGQPAEIIYFAIRDLLRSRDSLFETLADLIKAVPGGPEILKREYEQSEESQRGPHGIATWAAYRLVDAFHEREADEWLATLADDERGECLRKAAQHRDDKEIDWLYDGDRGLKVLAFRMTNEPEAVDA